MSTPSYQASLIFEHRENRRGQIAAFFLAELGRRFSSSWLHAKFGTAFRARASEINADPDEQIVIRNEHCYDEVSGCETSCYWSELRAPVRRHLDLG